MRLPVELINGWIQQGRLWPVLAAPFVGSFLGVLILRLPAGRPVVLCRSACEACGHALGAGELVPVLSFLVQRGRCRACAAPITPFHLHVELAAIAVALSAATQAQGALLWWSCALGWTLLALGWIDACTLRLPDMLTLPLLACGLAEAWAMEPEALPDRAVGAVIGYGAFWLLAELYAERGSRPKGWAGATGSSPRPAAPGRARVLWAN